MRGRLILFAGEAEETLADFLRLAARHDGRDRLAEVPGLTYVYGGRAYHNTLPRDGYELLGGRGRRRPWPVRSLPAGISSGPWPTARWSWATGWTGRFYKAFSGPWRACSSPVAAAARASARSARSCTARTCAPKTARQVLEEIEGADALVAQGRLTVGRWDLFKYTDVAESNTAR